MAALLLLRRGHASTSVSCGELCGVPTSLSKHVRRESWVWCVWKTIAVASFIPRPVCLSGRMRLGMRLGCYGVCSACCTCLLHNHVT